MFVQLVVLKAAAALLAGQRAETRVPVPSPVPLPPTALLANASLAQVQAGPVGIDDPDPEDPTPRHPCTNFGVEPCRNMARLLRQPDYDPKAEVQRPNTEQGETGENAQNPGQSFPGGDSDSNEEPEDYGGCKPFLRSDPYWGNLEFFPTRSTRTWLTKKCCQNQYDCAVNMKCDPCQPPGTIRYGPIEDIRWCIPEGLEKDPADSTYLMCVQPTNLADRLTCEFVEGVGYTWKMPNVRTQDLLCTQEQSILSRVIMNQTTRAEAFAYTRPPTPAPTMLMVSVTQAR